MILRKLLQASAATALLISPMQIFAESWITHTRITGAFIYEEGDVFIKTSNNGNPDGCSSAHYLLIDSATSNFKSIWAMVLMAQATDASVSLLYDGCLGQWPRIRAVAIPSVW